MTMANQKIFEESLLEGKEMGWQKVYGLYLLLVTIFGADTEFS